MRVYTKGGDRGETSLVGGERVPKYDPRVEAYGTVDELTAFIGLLADKIEQGAENQGDATAQYLQIVDDLGCVNSMLMNIEAHLAAGENCEYKLPEVGAADVEWLEQKIDEMQAQLPQLANFTLPGGDERVSLCHVARTITRRAERRAAEAATKHNIAEVNLHYINRLSDYFYLLGRTIVRMAGVCERLWRAK